MQETTNYQLPKYESTDIPNLILGYNSAVEAIDTQMKANADAASAADTKATAAQSSASTAYTKATRAETKADAANTGADAAWRNANTAISKADTNAAAITALDTRVEALEEAAFSPSPDDATLDVSALSTAKVTSLGIVYIPQS